MTCFCVVSLSGTTAASLSTAAGPSALVLLVAHASGCHLFNGEEFLRGTDHSRCDNNCKHWGFDTSDAGSMDLVSCAWLCVGVQCAKTWCCVNILIGGSFSPEKKGTT